MLMEVVTLIVNCLTGPVNNLCIATCVPVMSIKDNIESLEKEVRELQSRKEKMIKEIEDAELEDKEPTPEVTLWLENISKFPGKAKDVVDQFEKMCKCLGSYHPNVLSSYQLSKRAEKLLRDAKNLKERNFQEIASKTKPSGSARLPVGSMIGRMSELKRLQELFLDDEKSVIGIYGMAGVGKTMLLDKFYSEFQGGDRYHLYWVNMDSCRNVEDAQKAIAEELGLHLNENEKQDLNTRGHRIFGYLHNKKFVLVLDSVWQPIDLNKVGIPPAARSLDKFKVILTTRLESVCDRMLPQNNVPDQTETRKLKVECLGQEAAQKLFWQTAGNALIYADQWIKNDAWRLVGKCGGLPLALVTLGRAMASKRTAKSWKHAIKQIDFAPWEIAYMEEELLRCLRPSYDNLANCKLKTCFLYCCLFPANSLIDKECIICYCIGEGIIRDPFDDATDMFNDGHEILATLCESSLLEESGDDDSFVKMHPITRALPLLMECEHGANENKLLVRAKMALREAPGAVEWRGAERISLMNNNIEVLNDIPDSPSLITLLMAYNKELNYISEGFFRSMQNLRVLDLSHTSIKEVPAGIGELVALQYLNFSNTKLTSLPQELGNLVRLRTLLLSRMPLLTSIPQGLIARLSELRLLSMYVSYEDWKVDSVGDGVDFDELYRLKNLKVLGISVNTVQALQKLAKSYRLCKSARELEIRLSPSLTTLSTATLFWECKALKWIRLSTCSDLEKLEIDTFRGGENQESSTLPNLTDLYLLQLPKAKITWKSGHLENLSYIEITACREMRQLIHCDDDDSIKEGTGEKQEIDILPKLKCLNLTNLLELESLTCGRRPLAFPSLEVLKVKDCPKLKQIPENAKKLREIHGQRSWWNKLDWPTSDSSDTIKSKFQSYFKSS